MGLFKKKKIKCIECGYLVEYENNYCECYKQQIKKFRGIIRDKRLEDATKNIPRICDYYLKKIPGLTPQGHLEHQLYKGPGVNLSRWALGWSIVAVVISGIAAAIALWGR